jgi:imidazole glycerol phosphate synthase subunit HisF
MKSNINIRIMPCLDMQNGRVVKGVHFVDIKDAVATVLLAASVFHFGIISIPELKRYLGIGGFEPNASGQG